MQTGLIHLHSTLAIAVIIALLLTILLAVIKKPVTPGNRKLAKISMILLHTQILLGLILYFISDKGFSNFSSEAMGDSISRLYILEHPLMGILAAVLVTVGHAQLKRAKDFVAAKPILIFYTLGLVLVLSRVPWSTWSWFV